MSTAVKVTIMTSARGSVSQFGEVKVKPLSVPASRGKTCPQKNSLFNCFIKIIIVYLKSLIPKLSGIIGWFIAMLAGDCYVGGLEGGWVVWTWGGALIIELTYTRRGLACKQLHR